MRVLNGSRRGWCVPLILIATIAATVPARAEFLGAKNSWSAHAIDGSHGKTCYMHSVPTRKRGKYKSRGEAYVQVTHRPKENVRNEVSFTAGYTFKAKSQVEVDIGGKRFTLFTHRDTAWAPDRKSDAALVTAMIRGSRMIVRGTSTRGTKTTDTYSLSGFTAAHKMIDSACRKK